MNVTEVIAVGLVLLASVGITYLAARRNKSAEDHYVAGRSNKGWQNGLAIAGDYISGSTLLGYVGAIALTGYAGMWVGIASPVAIALVLVVLAEPLRRLGRYTISDIVVTRFDRQRLRGFTAAATIVTMVVYMVVQFVGSGLVISLLLGTDFIISTLAVGVLVILYSALGGMRGATWMQVTQMVLLAVVFVVFFVLVGTRFNFSPLLAIREAIGAYGEGVVVPRQTDTATGLSNLSLQVGIILGFLGMPHVLMRFFTVPDIRAARSSGVTATWVFAIVYTVMPIVGYAAAAILGREEIAALNSAGNLAILQLAMEVGGTILFSFMLAVVLVTILASLSAMCMAAAGAFGHDIFVNVVRRGRASEVEQHRAGQLGTLLLGGLALVIALAASEFNIAFLGTLAFAIAGSAILPTLLYSVYWRRFSAAGAMSSITAGLVSAVGLILISPVIMGEAAIFPLTNPALVSAPIGFLAGYVGSLLFPPQAAERERASATFRVSNGLSRERVGGVAE